MLENTPVQFGDTVLAAEPVSVKLCEKCGSRFSGDARFCPFDAEPLRVATAEESPQDPLLGTTIDERYEVEAVVGEGGMGTVYRVRHRMLDKRLALKVLRADLARDADLGVRFLREAKAAASVAHPNVVQITDFGNLPSGQPYFVMELLVGSSLSGIVRRGGPLPAARAVRLLLQMVDALAAAHDAGVIHRDLKPDNIVVCPAPQGREIVKVLDFGLAKVAGQSRLTRQGLVFGTPHYMSPEQASGGTIDPRTDVYSLGIVMYEMFTGKVPFEADSYMGVLTKHLYVEPTPPSVLLGGVAELGALEQVTLRCLEKKPEKRHPSMRVLGEELRRVATFTDDGGLVVSPAELGEPRAHRLADELELPSAAELERSLARAGLPRHALPFWVLPAAVFGGVAVLAALLVGLRSRGPGAPTPPASAPPRPPRNGEAPASARPPRAHAPSRVPAPPPVGTKAENPPVSDSSNPGVEASGHVAAKPAAQHHGKAPAPANVGTPNSSTAKGKMLGGEIVDPWSK